MFLFIGTFYCLSHVVFLFLFYFRPKPNFTRKQPTTRPIGPLSKIWLKLQLMAAHRQNVQTRPSSWASLTWPPVNTAAPFLLLMAQAVSCSSACVISFFSPCKHRQTFSIAPLSTQASSTSRHTPMSAWPPSPRLVCYLSQAPGKQGGFHLGSILVSSFSSDSDNPAAVLLSCMDHLQRALPKSTSPAINNNSSFAALYLHLQSHLSSPLAFPATVACLEPCIFSVIPAAVPTRT